MSLLISAITTGFLSTYKPAVATRSTPYSYHINAARSDKSRKVVDDLIDWGMAAQSGENPFEFPAPTLVSVHTAVRLVTHFGLPEAFSVAPNGDGGVSFESEEGSTLLHLDIDEFGNLEITIFSGAKVIHSRNFEARDLQ
jgi:hypothetical protein